MSLRFVLIGHPVAHSLSPVLHQSAYRALELGHRYELVDCPDRAAVEQELSRLARGETAGINVTLPWKRLTLELAARKDPLAAQIGAANVVAREPDGSLKAYNTDATALLDELRPADGRKRALIIGAGGAARAAIVACRTLGVGEIVLSSRRFQSGQEWPDSGEFARLGAMTVAWPGALPERASFQARVAGSDIVIQATSAGMHGADPGEEIAALVPWDRLAPGAFAYDVVYTPAITPFLRAAREARVLAQGGLGMLIGQAALSLERWLGSPAPRDAMRGAAEAELSRRAEASSK